MRLRRLARGAVGAVLLGSGLILMILPGPGIPLVVAGLVLLEWDGGWLPRLRRWAREVLAQLTRSENEHGFVGRRARLLSDAVGTRVSSS
jgi:hypothetical protein